MFERELRRAAHRDASSSSRYADIPCDDGTHFLGDRGPATRIAGMSTAACRPPRRTQPVREAGIVGRAVARIQLDGAVRDRELGLPRDAPNSARHEGVPVLMTDLEPGTLLFTFAQRWP